MADESGAAPVAEQEEQQEQEQQQQEDAAVEEAGAGIKKRERDDAEQEEGDSEPTAKRHNTNGEGEGDEPAAGAGDPPAGGEDGSDCPGPAGAAEAGQEGNNPGADDNPGNPGHEGGNPGHHEGGNPGHHEGGNPGHGAGAPVGHADDREYTEHPDGSVSEVMHIAKTMIGKLIGKGGTTIMGLQTSTGVSIQVDQATATRGGECRRVTLKGAPAAVESAKAQVEAVLAADAPGAAAAGGEITSDVKCPQGVVGRIIGRAGETIKLLQGASGAYILVNQNFPDGEDRVITVSGNADSVERASNMIRDLISSDQISVQNVIQKYGHGKTIKMQCPRSAVGRIIGRGGETVKMLQRKYNASVQINQATDPMDVTIIATPHEAEACQAEINHIIMHPDVPSGMGMGGPGGFRGGPGMGMGGPRGGGGPGYGMPPYGGMMPGMPYGGMPYGGMMGGYGGYGMGGPAPAMMGGYGGYGMGGGYDAAAAYGGGYGQQQQQQQQQQQYGGAAAAPAAGGAGGSVWQAIPDDQGRTYYYNTQTGVSQWEKPAEMP